MHGDRAWIDEFSIERFDKRRERFSSCSRSGEERREEEEEGEDSSSWVNLLVIRGLGWQTLASFPLFAIFARWIVLRSPRRDPKRKSKISFSIESSVTRERTLAPLSPFNEPRLNFEERRGRGRREKKEKEKKEG